MKTTIYLVMRGKSLLEGIQGRSERDAHVQLGRYLLPIDIAFDGATLYEVGRQACLPMNKYSVVSVDVVLPDTEFQG